MAIQQEGEFTIDVFLSEKNDVVIEIDFYVNEGNTSQDSDWDNKAHLEIYEYRVYSEGCEINLDLEDDFLYDVLRKELRKRDIEADCTGDY